MTELIELTRNYWKVEDCARSTSCGLLDYYNLKEAREIIYKSILPFAEGTGERSICGSVSGALAAISYILSEKNSINQAKEKFLMNLKKNSRKN